MDGFSVPLDLRDYEPGEWVVLRTMSFTKAKKIYTVPRGFVTDLASIPRMFRAFLDINGKSRRAAVLHDYLYCAQITTRKGADDLFLYAMELSKMNWFQRNLMYTGVRVGGWVGWNRNHPGPAKETDFVPDDFWGTDE